MITLQRHETIIFAIEEYKKYSKKTGNNEVPMLNIDTMSTFDISEQNPPNSLMDDYIYIDVKNGKGIISGNNERSVLIAVYRFFTELGCRFLRPGSDGEYIPQIDMRTVTVSVKEAPSYRHRGICIEGANSNENILSIIDWLPKVGMNGYFIQFRQAHTFYDRWYRHLNNPLLPSESFSVNRAQEYVTLAECEIKKRSLLYHAVGHGWTCEPFGIVALGWEKENYNLTAEQRQSLALVNGERKIYNGVALDTNLCYSNEIVRKTVVNDVVNYLKSHRNIDVLHFWLSDGWNCHCECEECQKLTPSDYYVILLNEIDESLTQNNINTKIVFLVYIDLLWTPRMNIIKNKERFILMFAPITRTYTKGFSGGEPVTFIPPYVRNKLSFPRSIDENLAHLKEWQLLFDGDSFDFDYHLYVDHYCDPGLCDVAKILHDDIQNLDKIGLDGYISCQVQRMFFPSGFACYIMAKTLWDKNCSYEEQQQDYFYHAFGTDAELCIDYLYKLTELFCPPYLRGELKEVDYDKYLQFCKIPALINNFLPTIEVNCKLRNGTQLKSWKYLKVHAKIYLHFAEVSKALALGDTKKMQASWKQVKQCCCEHEKEIQPVFDVFKFISKMDNKLLNGKNTIV